jgi:hypothetical protein
VVILATDQQNIWFGTDICPKNYLRRYFYALIKVFGAAKACPLQNDTGVSFVGVQRDSQYIPENMAH